MRLIIAGSRHLQITPDTIGFLVDQFALQPTVVLSGEAQGADRAGANWAMLTGVKLERYPADWHRFGKSAGHRRNRLMASFADALLLVWDGKSSGSKSMKEYAEQHQLKIFEVIK